MKRYLLAALVLISLAAQQPQAPSVQPVASSFYELQSDAVGYRQLADTAAGNTAANAESIPVHLSKGDQVLVTGKLGARWRRFFYRGYDYFISTASLKYTKDQAGRRSAGSSDYAQRRGESSGRTIQTGPRGGRYYINSNGNKTYIKH